MSIKSASELHYVRRFTSNHFILTPSLLSLMSWVLGRSEPLLSFSLCNIPSVYRTVGGSIKLLLIFASTITPGLSLLEIRDQHFYSYSNMYVFRNGAFSSTKERSVLLRKRYVCCTVVPAQAYPRCHGTQVTMDSVHPLPLHYTK
jgi:hypothetical protein